MTRSAADILQVVVFAAGADTLLRSGCPDVGAFFLAEEAVLELVHSGVGKKQRRIVVRDQGRRRDNRVASIFKKFQKKLTYFATGFHRAFLSLSESVEP